MTRTTPTRARGGFTLVELMVSAAVCVIIMAVLATAFQTGIDTMRSMKSTGDLMTQLRSAGEVIKRDLKTDHFIGDSNGIGRRLSEQRLDQLQVTDTMPMQPAGTPGKYQLGGWAPPKEGFFRIKSTPSSDEGFDGDGLQSSRATDHYMHFTSILLPEDTNPYTAGVGTQKYITRTAEIAYFLDPSPTGSAGTSPLYHLIRRQRLLAKNSSDQAGFQGIDATQYPTWGRGLLNARAAGSNYVINTLADVNDPTLPAPNAFPNLRLGRSVGANPTTAGDDGTLATLSGNTNIVGDDILISNVISFEVKVLWQSPTNSVLPASAYPAPRAFSPGVATENPFDSLPACPNGSAAGSYVFDTWAQITTPGRWDNVDQTTGALSGPGVPPLAIRVKAVQIRLRVYDPKLKNVRQMTIIQDL